MSNAIISPYFFFNDTATTEIYTLSLHDALPLLMELALAPSVEGLLKMLVARSAESPELISLQIWLVQKMDGSLQIAAASGKVPPACSAARVTAEFFTEFRQQHLTRMDDDHPD